MEIRAVAPDELEEAGRVTADAYREFVPPEPSGWDEYLTRIADVAARLPHTIVLVAVEEGVILGSVTIELTDRVPGGHERGSLASDEAHVRMLGVHPDLRGRGVARALMDACVAKARDAGKRRLTLDTTERMTVARRLYESMGFVRGPDTVYDDGFRLLNYELSL